MFPPEFVPLKKYHGYVWNIKEQKLYSFKGGCLKEMKLLKPYGGWYGYRIYNVPLSTEMHYTISHQGKRIHLGLSEFQTIKEDYKINYVKECENARSSKTI